MKKFLSMVFAMLMLLSLAACGDKAPETDAGKPEDTQQIEQTQNENTVNDNTKNENTENENTGAVTSPIKEFKSNDKQCVIYVNGAYVVYGLDGNNIISCTSYTEFDTIEIAKAAYDESVEGIKDDPDIVDCKLDGNTLICEYAKSAWEGRDKAMLEQVFADKLVK